MPLDGRNHDVTLNIPRHKMYSQINLVPGLSGLPSDQRGRRLIMVSVFETYIDDSGSKPQSPVFVLGGFVASVAQWAAFSNEWKAALELPPRLEYFKMAEAASLSPQGQFARRKGWNEPARDARVALLVDIIKKHVRLRTSATMRHDHFERYIKSIPIPERRLASDNPYLMLFQRVILGVAVRADLHGITEPSDFIFDEQTGFSAEALEWWPNFKAVIAASSKSDLPRLIGSPPIFRNDKQFLPLQAADLYAWQVRRHQSQSSTLWMPPSQTLRELASIPYVGMDYTEAEIIRLRRHLLAVGKMYVAQYPDIPLVYASKAARKKATRNRKKLAKGS